MKIKTKLGFGNAKNFEMSLRRNSFTIYWTNKKYKIKRKNVGKTTERLIVTIDKTLLTEQMYHI